MTESQDINSWKYLLGIGFWSGALIYNIINILLIKNIIPHNNILLYDYIILTAAIIGITINTIIYNKKNKQIKTQ